MAEELLHKLLSEQINIFDFTNWITNTSIKDSYQEIENFNCGYGEFVVYFLNHLRDQTASILNSSTTQPTPRTIQTPRKNSIGENSISKRPSSHRVELFPELTLNDNNFPSLPAESTPNKSNVEISKCGGETTPSSPIIHSTPKSDIYSPSPSSEQTNRNTTLVSSVCKINNETSLIKRSSSEKRNIKSSSMACFGDFIVERKSSKGKKCLSSDKPRRIKPTSLFTNTTDLTTKNDKPLLFEANIRDIESNSIFKICDVKENVHAVDDRNLLRAECLKISTLIPATPSKQKFNTELTPTNYIKPLKKSVTFLNILNIYIEIYFLIIENNFILNVINELYFIISLLLACQKDNEYQEFCEAFEKVKRNTHPEEFKSDEHFNSLHNCVYFACEILLKLQNFLQILDRPTLKFLQTNQRIQEFSPELHEKLIYFYQQKLVDSTNDFSYKNSTQNVVRFIPDTDNRNNFSTPCSFHAFRKQRDLFYEILHNWEYNHLNGMWDFSKLVKSIHVLMNLGNVANDPINFLHLARLFKYQLLSNCGLNGKTSIEEDTVLCSLKNISATKLSLLQSRLITPQTGENLNDFPGHQEFYKEFLICCEKPQFLQHLMDSFISEIHQLFVDGFQFQDAILDENNISPETKQKYSETIISLKLLSKFLSFIECLSYKSSILTPLPENLISIQHNVRIHVQSQLDLKQFLRTSIQNRSLIITLPWICDYFAMQDYVTIRLPTNKCILQILFEIYYHLRVTELNMSPIGDSVLNDVNMLSYLHTMPFVSLMYLRICLGWLFERPHFPEELFFHWLTNKYNHCLWNEFDGLLITAKHHVSSSQQNIESYNYHDCLKIIDERMLYKLCPYLSELRQLVVNSEKNLRSSKSYLTSRHITPVTTMSFNGPASTKQLEMQLEETFFNSHPSSVRKTVEFVSERVASACIKNICNTLVPNLKENAKKEFKSFLKTLKIDEIKQLEKIVQKQARIISDNYYSILCANCSPKNLCEDRCQMSLIALLGDLQESILKLCVEWTIRHSKEKILQWIQSHVSTDIFFKNFHDLIKHFLTTKDIYPGKLEKSVVLEVETKVEMTNEVFYNTLMPLVVLNTTRELIWKLMDREIQNYDVDELNKILSDILISITSRSDYIPFIFRQIIDLTVDLALVLVTFSPNLMKNKQILNTFINIWKVYQRTKIQKEEKHSQPVVKTVINNTLDANNINNMSSLNNDNDVVLEDLSHDDESSTSITTTGSGDQRSQEMMENRFSRMICSRNIFMLEQSLYPDDTWNAFGDLLFAMIYEDAIIESNNLDAQCTSFFHNDWPQVILNHFSITLNRVIQKYKNWKGCDDKFTLLLEFLSETSCNMNGHDFDFM